MANSTLIAIEIVGAAFVSLLLITNAMKWADSETPYKAYLAKDIGLVIESLIASPGNAQINYSRDISGYIIEIDSNSVTVYTKKESDGMTRNFIPMNGIKMSSINLENPKNLCFAKINDEIIIKENIKENLDLIYCPEKTKYKKENIKLLVNLKQEKNKETYQKLCWIANSFIINIGNKKFVDDIISTRKLHEKTNEDEIPQINCMDESYFIPEESADIILSIKSGDYNDNSNSIKAFVLSGSKNEQESQRLACLIINSIIKNKVMENIKITGASVVPVNLSSTNYDFPFDLISKYSKKQQDFEKVFVMLEIGNINSEDGRNMLEKIPEIGNSITEGFTDYER